MLLLLIACHVMPIAATTVNIEAGMFNYTIDTETGTAALTRYNDTGKTSIVIPAQITYNNQQFTVTQIAKYCFDSSYSVKSISIPKTIKEIYGNYEIPKLEKIIITDLKAWCNVKANGYFVNHSYSIYLNDKKIKKIVIPESVESISQYLFSYSDINEIIISNKTTNIGYRAFFGCTSLRKAEIGAKVINNGAFKNCSNLTSVYMTSEVQTVGKKSIIDEGNVFGNCNNLNQVIIDNIEAWCNISFYSNTSNPLYYAKNLYIGDKQVETLEIPNSINTIKDNHFQNGNFKTIVIPNSVESIGVMAFGGCAVKNIDFGNQLKEIQNYAFENCTNLENAVLPNSISTIGYAAFKGCSNLKSVTLPNAIVELSDFLFEDCINLEKIIIPNSIKTIWSKVFNNCVSLKDIIIPSSVEHLNDYIFLGTNLDCAFSFANLQEGAGYAFPNNSNLFVPKKFISYYGKNAMPFCKENITQTSIELASTEKFTLTNAVSKDGISCVEKDGIFTFNHLIPNKEYPIIITGEAFGRTVTGELIIKTLAPILKIELTNATNTTLSIKGSYEGNMKVIKENLGEYGNGNTALVKDLSPNQNVNFTYTITTEDGSTFSTSNTFWTKNIDLNVTYNTTSTSCTLTGSTNNIDAVITYSGFSESQNDVLKVTGLDPNTSYSYRYYVRTKDGWYNYKVVTFTTKAIQLETLQPKGVTNTCSVVSAKSNIDDEEVTAGFQWKKYDAPSTLKPSEGYTTVYNGTIEGIIKNLQPTSYYNVRAFYKSNTDKYYYGDWVTFDPSDFSYFEPTVHTYARVSVQSTSAKVKGVALQGTDDITEQGFEYWAENAIASRAASDKQIIQATGQSMEAEITNLAPNTTYNYRAYAKTSKGTTYGETLKFTTPVATAIIGITNTTNSDLQFNVRNTNNVQIAINGTDKECNYRMNSITGANIASGKTTADGEWHTIANYQLPSGIYIITVSDGKDKKSTKIAIK